MNDIGILKIKDSSIGESWALCYNLLLMDGIELPTYIMKFNYSQMDIILFY